MVAWRWFAAVAVCLALAACQKLGEPDPILRTAYDATRTGDMAPLRAIAAPELLQPGVETELARLRRILPKAPPTEAKAIGRSFLTTAGSGERLDATDLYVFKDSTAIVSGRMVRASKASPWRLQGLNVRVLRPQDLAANRFTFSGKGVGHYAFLAATIGSPFLMLAALVKVIRRKGLRRKWLWGIAAFAGLFTVQMNWTNGAVAVQWFTVQFIGAGLTTAIDGGVTPWILQFTLPIGALLILAGVWANPARAKARKGKEPAGATAFD